MDRSGHQEVSLAELAEKSLMFYRVGIDHSYGTPIGCDLSGNARPKALQIKLFSLRALRLCGSAALRELIFLWSAQANNSRPGKPPKKTPGQRPGIKGRTGLGMPVLMARKKGESGPTPGYSVFTKNTSLPSQNNFRKTVRYFCIND